MSIAITGALCQCPFGTMCAVNVLPITNVFISKKLCVRMPDAKALVNIPSFGMCTSPGNPSVVKIPPGIVVPTVCVPNITNTNWETKKNNVKICGQSVCTDGDTCMCSYGGVISIIMPGQFTVV